MTSEFFIDDNNPVSAEELTQNMGEISKAIFMCFAPEKYTPRKCTDCGDKHTRAITAYRADLCEHCMNESMMEEPEPVEQDDYQSDRGSA